MTIQLPSELIDARLKATREACNLARFGRGDVLTVSQRGSAANHGRLVVRIVPAGVEPLAKLASEGGQLVMRESWAEDLAQAVADSAMQKQRLQREYAALQAHQNRSDLSVTDLLVLTERIATVETQLATCSHSSSPLNTAHQGGSVASTMHSAIPWTTLTEGFIDTVRFIGYILPFLLVQLPLALAMRDLCKRFTRNKKRA